MKRSSSWYLLLAVSGGFIAVLLADRLLLFENSGNREMFLRHAFLFDDVRKDDSR